MLKWGGKNEDTEKKTALWEWSQRQSLFKRQQSVVASEVPFWGQGKPRETHNILTGGSRHYYDIPEQQKK